MRDITLTPIQIKLVNIFNDRFRKPSDYNSGKLFYTTAEMFAKLQNIFPSPEYEAQDVYTIMTYLNIETVNGAGDKFYWFLEENKDEDFNGT